MEWKTRKLWTSAKFISVWLAAFAKLPIMSALTMPMMMIGEPNHNILNLSLNKYITISAKGYNFTKNIVSISYLILIHFELILDHEINDSYVVAICYNVFHAYCS